MKAIKKYFVGTVAMLFVACMFLGVRMDASAAIPTGTVSGVKQANPGASYSSRTTLGIVWDMLPEAAGYAVFVRTSKTAEPVIFDAKQNSGAIITTGLTAGKVYYVSVATYDLEAPDSGFGPESAQVKAVTAPSNPVKTINQTTATTTSITLEWGALKDADGYEIDCYSSSGKPDKTIVVKGGTNKSKKITGLKKNTKYTFEIYPYREGDNSYRAYGIGRKYQSVPTLPTKASGVKNTYAKDGEARFSTNIRYSADGYQLEIYNGKTKIKTGTANYTDYNRLKLVSSKLKKSAFLKVRVRGYITVKSGKKYGEWSEWTYFTQPVKTKSPTSTAGGIKLSWDKVAGANNYTVYISTKLNAKNYPTAGTVKKNSITIKKCGKSVLKSGQRYYIYVIANKKVGGKTYKSYDDGSVWGVTYW